MRLLLPRFRLLLSLVAVVLIMGACTAAGPTSSTTAKTATPTGPAATTLPDASGSTPIPTAPTATPAPGAPPTATATTGIILPPAVIYTGVSFTHRAAPGTISGNVTVLDNPNTNGHPTAVLIVTQLWNPGGVGGVYNNHPIGVYYQSGAQRWAIYNQDFASMPTNASFNVRVAATLGSSTTCVHTASSVNGNTTTPTCGTGGSPSPSSQVFITANWNSPGSQVYVNAALGVYHAGNTWRIYREDQVAFPVNATINVTTLGGDTIFTHTASAGNSAGDYTIIDNPATNGKPNAVLTVTHNWNPGGASGVYNVHNFGVFYTSTGKWAVFNEDLTPIPSGASFNIGVV